MVELRKPVEFKHLKEGHNMLLPFGPHIVYSRMPNKIIKSLNKYVDLKVKRGHTEKLDHSEHLVGKVRQEFRIDTNQIEKVSSFFNAVFVSYHQFFLQRRNKALDPKALVEVFYNGAWIVRSFAHDYNPAHIHTECHLSCVGYLKLPDFSEEEDKEKKKHYPSHGNIELIHEGSGMYHQGGIRIKPEVGDFIVFPHYLLHTVYPFKGDGERRSFSMNISLNVTDGEKKING